MHTSASLSHQSPCLPHNLNDHLLPHWKPIMDPAYISFTCPNFTDCLVIHTAKAARCTQSAILTQHKQSRENDHHSPDCCLLNCLRYLRVILCSNSTAACFFSEMTDRDNKQKTSRQENKQENNDTIYNFYCYLTHQISWWYPPGSGLKFLCDWQASHFLQRHHT